VNTSAFTTDTKDTLNTADLAAATTFMDTALDTALDLEAGAKLIAIE